MYKKTVVLFGVFFASILAASPAFAAMEYYTYGGFVPVSVAFQNVAQIFGDNGYKGFIAAFTIMGLFFGGAMAYTKAAMGQGGTLSWLLPVMIGMGLYSSMFVPTTNLTIYDPVYNQNTTVAGVPVGVAYSASLVNTIERFVVTLFDTNAQLPPNTACGMMPSLQYAEQGGGVGMRAMQNGLSSYMTDSNASSSLLKYVDDCVSFELVRPGATLTINALLDPGCNQTVLDVIGLAANPANYTTTYLVNAPVGTG